MKQLKSNFDSYLLFFILLIMIFSCFSLYSAQKYSQFPIPYMEKQLQWFAIGFMIMAIIFYFDMKAIQNLSPYLYAFGIVLLLFVLFGPAKLTPEINGAKSWISLPGISIQPSEFMKIFLILMLSNSVYKHRKKYDIGDVKKDVLLIWKIGLISFLPLILTLLQNDFGTTLVMFVIVMAILFVSGIHKMLIWGVIGFLLLVIAGLVVTYIINPVLLLHLLDDYQLNRIYSWLDPFQFSQGIGYQLSQSIMAIGSGLSSGKGFNQTSVFIPEAHTDFIFAIVGEEYGFIGGTVLILVYFLIIYRIVRIGMMSTSFESYICAGISAYITFHIFQNIGMVSGLLPITGIPLPLMSYGGSSVMSTMLGLSIVLNISLKRKKYMFSD
ncbi:FtsW/RodA/SpoVE family cell cycle protein [Bacillus sp. 1P06AnD]|uniref:FtsW/RodA/SpoVE family cell cycle protein n=1 Tax=Bacillus sp. 1P06AnD TaxID=3132208 RepID=UPI0039A12952